MKLNKAQFIAQFPDKIDVSNILNILTLDSVFEGVEVYRALQKLIIKVDGQYYCKW